MMWYRLLDRAKDKKVLIVWDRQQISKEFRKVEIKWAEVIQEDFQNKPTIFISPFCVQSIVRAREKCDHRNGT